MKYIKVFERFDEVDELFLGVNINKGKIEDDINDFLVELLDEKFFIEVKFDSKLGINVEICKENFTDFSVKSVLEYVRTLEDYVEDIFGKLSISYYINSKNYNITGEYEDIDFNYDVNVLILSIRFKKG
jgi:hypothetical protein